VSLPSLLADRSCCIAPAILGQCQVTYDHAEERRLAYVALTRGMKRVTISHCAFRHGPARPSTFIKDIPDQHRVQGWIRQPERSPRRASATTPYRDSAAARSA